MVRKICTNQIGLFRDTDFRYWFSNKLFVPENQYQGPDKKRTENPYHGPITKRRFGHPWYNTDVGTRRNYSLLRSSKRLVNDFPHFHACLWIMLRFSAKFLSMFPQLINIEFRWLAMLHEGLTDFDILFISKIPKPFSINCIARNSYHVDLSSSSSFPIRWSTNKIYAFILKSCYCHCRTASSNKNVNKWF